MRQPDELRHLAVLHRLYRQILRRFQRPLPLQDRVALFNRLAHGSLELFSLMPRLLGSSLFFEPIESRDFRIDAGILRIQLAQVLQFLRRVSVLPCRLQPTNFFRDRVDLLLAAAQRRKSLSDLLVSRAFAQRCFG